MNNKILLTSFIVIFPFFYSAFTQDVRIDSCLTKRDDAYINRQDKVFLEEIDQTLKEYPPRFPVQKPRYLLLLMDAVMHDPYAAFRIPVQQFYHKRIENALKEIETTKVEDGARIWKLYNMGFIVPNISIQSPAFIAGH